MRTHEARLASLASELAVLRPVPRLAPQVVEDRLNEWRRLLRGSTTQARAVIQRVVQGRITFALRADGLGYDFTAQTRFDRLFTGVYINIDLLPDDMAFAAGLAGFNEPFGPPDTLDCSTPTTAGS